MFFLTPLGSAAVLAGIGVAVAAYERGESWPLVAALSPAAFLEPVQREATPTLPRTRSSAGPGPPHAQRRKQRRAGLRRGRRRSQQINTARRRLHADAVAFILHPVTVSLPPRVSIHGINNMFSRAVGRVRHRSNLPKPRKLQG